MAKRKKKAKKKTTKRKPAKKKAKKKTKRKAKKKTKRKAKKKKGKRKPNAAFMAPLKVSAALGAVVGNKPLPRTQVVKKLWQYIKRKKLQDNKNRRQINCDANLKLVFGGKKNIDMFQMMKHLKKHLTK